MIVVIAPYEKLKALADSLTDRYDVPIRTVVGDLGAALMPARAAVAEGAILVSRGGTAKLIRETLGVDVIEIGVARMELLRLLKPYIGGERRVAVVGFRTLTDHAEELCRSLDIPAVCLPVDHASEVGSRLRSLSGMNVDCLIGDMVTIRSAGGVDAELHLIESDAEAMTEALDKAVIVARSVLFRRESDIRIRAVFNSVQDGLLSVDRDGLIDQLNPKAGELLGAENPRGVAFDAFVPNLDIARILGEGRDSFGHVAEIQGRRTVVNVTPVAIGGRTEGAVAVIQEVGKIQDLEKRVRKELFAKGLFAKHTFRDVFAESREMRNCLEIARQYARTSGNIVIYGETGTGKELLAQSIHNESSVGDGPFVAVNCGALPPTLLESELFGYVEGAFTGAVKGGKEGLFELAHGGTIFLDEINELDFSLQTKLLRVLQEREVMRVGDTRVIPVSVRVLVASNIPLRDEVEGGRIRKDLFYRLNVLDIRIPPLRERSVDILPLFKRFARATAQRNGDPVPERFPADFSTVLVSRPWPGNVRELENAAEKYVVLRRLLGDEGAAALVAESLRGDQDACADKPDSAEDGGEYRTGTLDEIERRVVRDVFEDEERNLSRAARRLGVDRQTLRKKLTPP